MQQWEYASLVAPASSDSEINIWGQLGWQCYAVLPLPIDMVDQVIAGPGYQPKVRFYLKRPLISVTDLEMK